MNLLKHINASVQLNAEKGLPTYTLSSFIDIGSSWMGKRYYKEEQETRRIEETLGGKSASLKIGSFTIYEIQHNSEFPVNQTLFSSPTQSSEAFIVHKQQTF